MITLMTHGMEIDFSPLSLVSKRADKKRGLLLQKADEARLRARDAKEEMVRQKFAIEELAEQTRKNPTTLNIEKLRQSGEAYSKIIEEYVGANYALYYADQAAQGAGIVVASREAAVQIYPTLAEIKQDLRQAVKAQEQNAAAQSLSAHLAATEAVLFAKTDYIASMERLSLLQDLAKMPTSTAEDGQNLLRAVEQLKADRKTFYQANRDVRLGALMAAGKTEFEARAQFAQEIRQQRRHEDKTGARAERLCTEKSCKRLGAGLVRGDVQYARQAMPKSIEQHHNGKQMKKSAKVERETARRKMDMHGLRQSVDRYTQASVRMTLGILNELTHELMMEGYTRPEARKRALEKFKAEHEKRKNGNDATAYEWKQNWANYRSDVNLVRAVSGTSQTLPNKAAQTAAHSHPAVQRKASTSGRPRVVIGLPELARTQAMLRAR